VQKNGQAGCGRETCEKSSQNARFYAMLLEVVNGNVTVKAGDAGQAIGDAGQKAGRSCAEDIL
jgi:hypothetical protein